MKKLITVLLLVIAATTFAQQNARGIKDNGVKQCGKCGVTSGRLSVNYGLSKASSSSANMSTSKLSNFGLDYFHPIAVKEYFSWGFNVGGQYMFGASAPFSASLPSAFPITTQITTEVSGSGNTKTAGYFAGIGPQINLRIADRFVFSPIFQVGYLGVTQSEFKATQSTLIQGFALPNYTRKYDLISQTETKTNGLGFIPKARLTYMFTNKFGLWAEASYLLGPSQKSAVSTFKPQGVANNQGAYTVQQMNAGTYVTANNQSKYNSLGYSFGLSFGFGGNNKPKSNQNEIKLVCAPIIKPQVDTIYCVKGKIHFYGRVYIEANGTKVSELKLTSVKDKQGNNVLTDIKLPMKMVFAEPDFPFNFEIDTSNCGKDLTINFETKSVCTSKTQVYKEIITKGTIIIPAKRIPCCNVLTSNSNDDDERCEGNPIINGDFTDGLFPGKMPIGKIKDWTVGYMDAKIGAPVIYAGMGFFDNGYVKLEGNKLLGNAIAQQTKIEKGKIYKFRLMVKYDGANYAKIGIFAFNGQLSTSGAHPTANTDIAIVARSGKLTNCGDWTSIEFTWKAYKDFSNIAINAYNNELKKTSSILIDNVIACETTSIECAEIALDANNNPIIPIENGVQPTALTVCAPIQDEDSYINGALKDIYGYDGSDAMYEQMQNGNPATEDCANIGGELPQDILDFNCEEELKKEGITDDCNEFDKIINTPIPDNPIKEQLVKILPLSNNNIECKPLSEESKRAMAFGGKDIIYIHGLQFKQIGEKILFNKKAQTEWPQDPNEFYNSNGYYKSTAIKNFKDHIGYFLRGKGYNNRYLIVCYNSSQRAEVAIHSVMAQIREAMQNGTGVQVDSGDKRGKDCFGKNYVLISHSTGALIGDLVLAEANNSKVIGSTENNKYGNVGYVSDRCKGHISMHGAIGGSNLAAVPVAVSVANSIANPTTSIAGVILDELGFPPIVLAGGAKTAILNSILVDLTPAVVNTKWKALLNQVPVPVLTISGTHPGPRGTGLFLFQRLLPGFDDGVVNTESSSGKDKPFLMPISSIVAKPKKLFDMGIPDQQARRYFKDRMMGIGTISTVVTSLALNTPIPFSIASSPNLSPTGMVEPMIVKTVNNQLNNHYTFIQSASEHFIPTNDSINVHPIIRIATKTFPFYRKKKQYNYYFDGDYSKTVFSGLSNNQEQLVTKNTNLYANGIIDTKIIDYMQETIKKKTVGFHFFKWIKRPGKLPKLAWKYKEYIIWKRTYHNLDETYKYDMDYAYKFLFPN